MISKTELLVITAVIVGFCLAGPASSQTQWLSDSSRAIQFGVGSSFNVHAFGEKEISFKTHITAMRALRLSLSFSGTIDQRDRPSDCVIRELVRVHPG